jgi:nucleoside-diphosphate-sugar epimerase
MNAVQGYVSRVTRSALVVGCGFVGLPLARALHAAGWTTHALTGSRESAAKLQSEPFEISAADITAASNLATLGVRLFDVVIHCASSGRGGAASYEQIYLNGTENLLTALECRHFIMASSTSVYAQTDGSTINETAETVPARETGRILLRTEKRVLEANGTVGRIAGIYSPERSVPLRKLLAGEAILEGEGERVMNMIHREDAASALFFLAETGARGIFNIADGHSVTQFEWYAAVCERTGQPMPRFGPRNLDRKRAWTNKRVSSQKICSLGWRPKYPTFLEGLGLFSNSKQ